MKGKQGPQQQSENAPEQAPEQGQESDPQQLYGNAFVQEAMAVENGDGDEEEGGGRRRRGGGGGPTGVERFSFIPDQMGGIAMMNLVPQADGEPIYAGLQLHEHVGTPQAMRGHFPDSALNPALASEHGGSAATAASRFNVGDVSRPFPVDPTGNFIDNHHGFGIPNPEWILPDAFARGIGWTVDQYYTLDGRRLAGNFHITRIGYYSGGDNLRIVATKTQVG